MLIGKKETRVQLLREEVVEPPRVACEAGLWIPYDREGSGARSELL